jgi:hypothetical protein
VDNVGALSMPFIGQYDIGRRAVKGREAVMVEFQWRREIETGKGRRCGAIIFGGEEGEEVRWLHSAGCGSWCLKVKDDQRKLDRLVKCVVESNC